MPLLYKNSTLKKMMTKKFKKSRSKTKYPTRLSGSRINYTVARQVDRAMSRVSENKVSALTKFNEVNPTPIQVGAQAFTTQYMIGNIPTVWAGTRGLNSLTSFGFPTTGAMARNGDSVYLNKTTLSIELDMNQTLPSRQVTEFRVITFKARRGDTPLGISHTYKTDLFLDVDGNYFGHETGGITGTDLMLQPVNKKYWNVLSDKKFTMSPSDDNASTYNSSKYGIHRTMRFTIPWYKKVSFDAPGSDSPDNIDFRWVVAVFARPIGKDGNADSWETNVRGLTTFKDN